MAHGPRYTQMAHGGFKSDDRGTWVGLPLETTFFCLIPSHLHFFRENVFHCSSIFCISLSVQMFSYVVFPLAGTMLSLFYSCSARECDSCMFGFRFERFFKENKENKIGHFSSQSCRMCHLIVPKICRTPGLTEKDRFSKGFQKAI